MTQARRSRAECLRLSAASRSVLDASGVKIAQSVLDDGPLARTRAIRLAELILTGRSPAGKVGRCAVMPVPAASVLARALPQKSSSFCLPVEPEGFASNETPSPQISEVDRDVAREVLGTVRERRFGHRVGLFDTKVVGMVAARVSAINGDRETKLRATGCEIAHALGVSRGTPTPSFVWGNIDHFLEHEAGGPACGPPPEVLQFMAELRRGESPSPVHSSPQISIRASS